MCNSSNSKGSIIVTGLGPGSLDFTAPAAIKAVEESEVVAGYSGYISLLNEKILEGKEVISNGMMGEVARCTAAVEAAQAGKKVCMVCSGDPGIYAMAGLVLEIIETKDLFDKVDFKVIPGIPAFAAGAALLGAPLMHDFASVSLSDLLTPWEKIEKRLDLAADADFVIALYNPKSKKRADHLSRAIEIVKKHRKGSTPVGIVNRAAREGENVTIMTLDTLDENKVDMQTVVIIGNSATRITGNKMLTPRGYADKYNL